MSKKLLIIGCGTSGTRYTAKLLTNMGLSISHERSGLDGKVDWHSVGIPNDVASADVIWHQVRRPLGVIASIHTATSSSWKFIQAVDPRIKQSGSRLLRCMKYWLYWNQLCEGVASKTFQVESIANELPELMKVLDREMPTDMENIIKSVSTSDHTRKIGTISKGYPHITWKDLVAEDADIASRIMIQTTRYGYDLKN